MNLKSGDYFKVVEYGTESYHSKDFLKDRYDGILLYIGKDTDHFGPTMDRIVNITTGKFFIDDYIRHGILKIQKITVDIIERN